MRFLWTGYLSARHDFWPRPLSVDTLPTVTTCKANTGKTPRFLRFTELGDKCGADQLAMTGRPASVIREKSQFRAQDDSLSLSPRSMTAPSLYLTSEPRAALFLWAAYFFAPGFTRERMSAGHLPQSSSAFRFAAGASDE